MAKCAAPHPWRRRVLGAAVGVGITGTTFCARALSHGPVNLVAITALHSASDKPACTVNFSGKWVKDRKNSDSMDPALDLCNIRGLTRTAVQLVRGMEIHQTDEMFELAIFSAIPKIKIREKYQFDGQPSTCRRRDLRSGKHQGAVRWLEGGEKLQLDLTWEEPYGGSGYDVFSLPSPDTLYVDSVIKVAGGELAYRSIYHSKHKK